MKFSICVNPSNLKPKVKSEKMLNVNRNSENGCGDRPTAVCHAMVATDFTHGTTASSEHNSVIDESAAFDILVQSINS